MTLHSIFPGLVIGAGLAMLHPLAPLWAAGLLAVYLLALRGLDQLDEVEHGTVEARRRERAS